MPNPDLEITGGPGHPDPEIRKGSGGGTVSQIFFTALRASVWSKNKEGGPGPYPGSTTEYDRPDQR